MKHRTADESPGRQGLLAAALASTLALSCTVSPGVDAADGIGEGDPAGPTTSTGGDEPATPVSLPEKDAGTDAEAAASPTGDAVVRSRLRAP